RAEPWLQVLRGCRMRFIFVPAAMALLAAIVAAGPAVCQESKNPLAGKPIPDLTELLKHKDARVRLAAVLALREAGQEADVAVKPLAERLKDANALIRRTAALTLGGLGADAAEAAPQQGAALRHRDTQVRRQAA